MANEDEPPYNIVKDLFEYIYKRMDNLIDLTEWMDTFNKYEYNPAAHPKKNIFLNPSK